VFVDGRCYWQPVGTYGLPTYKECNQINVTQSMKMDRQRHTSEK
jgi:hypothetical protein